MSARVKMEKTRHPGIYKRDGKTGTSYYVVANVGIGANGKPKQKWHSGFRSLREAKAAQAEINSRVERGTYIEPAKLSLRDWVNEWLQTVEPSLRPSTFESYKKNLTRHVLGDEVLAGSRLQQISPSQLNRLYASLSEPRTVDAEERSPLSTTTIRYIHTTLRLCLSAAVKDDKLVRNPADRATPPKAGAATRAPMITWTANQLRTFLEHVRDDRLYAAWRVAALTGVRRGELLGLRWAEVDLDGEPARIRITQTLIGDLAASTPKTASGYRSIDLDPATADALRAHRAQQAKEKLALGPGYNDRGLVFCREDGTPSWPRTFSRAFEKHVSDLEMLPRIPLKNLRHTHATLLLSSGVSPKVIQERLGHADVLITLRTYAHATPAMRTDATAKAAALVDRA